MKPLRGPCILLLISVFLLACRSASVSPRRSLTGRVVDPQNRPVAGVQVSAPGRRPVSTDGKGEFALSRLGIPERFPVTFSSRDYLETTRIYTAGAGSGSTVIVWPRVEPVTLDAAQGGRLKFPAGTVEFPPNAFVDDGGLRVRGNVRVSLSAFDVTDPLQLANAPGDLTASMSDGTTMPLESFGMFDVFVQDALGRRLNLAAEENASVQLTIPPSLRRTTPDEVGLFRFDRSRGRWVEEGRMSRISEAVLAASISDLTVPWNADQVLETTCIRLRLLDCDDCGDGPVVAGVTVAADGVGYAGKISTGTTDANGEVCLSVKKNATVRITADHPTKAGVKINPIEVETPDDVASAADCGDADLCPLVATTHFAYGGFHDDLNATNCDWFESDNSSNSGDPAFNVGWREDHANFASGRLVLSLSDAGCPAACSNMAHAAGEYRTSCFYGYGTYKAKFRAAQGEGLVTTFFTYTDKHDQTFGAANLDWHDEIDVEVLGRAPKTSDGCSAPNDKGVMQTNYFGQHQGGHEKIVCLDFQPWVAENTYEFEWTDQTIKWYVNRDISNGTNLTPVHTESRQTGVPWPMQAGRVMVNFWSGTAAASSWLGTFDASATPLPIQVEYDWISYTP